MVEVTGIHLKYIGRIRYAILYEACNAKLSPDRDEPYVTWVSIGLVPYVAVMITSDTRV
jgi:hypothetical protein